MITKLVEANRLLDEINAIEDFEKYLYLNNYGVDYNMVREKYFIDIVQGNGDNVKVQVKKKK